MNLKFFTLMVLLFMFGCSGLGVKYEDQVAQAKDAVKALQESQFDLAQKLASDIIAKDKANPQAHLILAITKYKKAMHQFVLDLMTTGTMMFRQGMINHKYIRNSLEELNSHLIQVDGHLTQASEESQVSLELCLACWKIDWNHDGRIDRRDTQLLEIEVDAEGKHFDSEDPRRRPTFRFDIGDVFWAKAMVSFQRAMINSFLAYKLPEMVEFFAFFKGNQNLTIRLVDKKYIQEAKKLIIAGFENSDKSRKEYLAEKDDDREWIPNPTQKNHPMPLPVDEALYKTWEYILGDLIKLMNGEEGISIAEVAQFGDHKYANPPSGYLNVAELFNSPGDIVINPNHMESFFDQRNKEAAETVLKDIFGNKYVKEMKPSQIMTRLNRMKNEVMLGHDTIEKKMKYLFWIN